MYLEEGCYLPLTKKLKEVASIPVISAGKLGDPELAERAINEGAADGISLGRPLLTDPEWVMKVRRGETDDIRPCIGCHEACLKRISRCKPLSCAVNPQVGREETYSFTKSARTKDIVVIGGGIAGMEASRVLASRGHRVRLFEADEELGGHVIEGSQPFFKKDDRRLLAWYKRQMSKLPIEISMGAKLKPEDVLTLSPEIVIVATGSVPSIPPIPGIKDDHVLTTKEALMKKRLIGHRAAVIGGGLVGCELAYELRVSGREVSIVEFLPNLMQTGDVAYPNKLMLLELLALHKVETHTGVYVKEKTSLGITLSDGVEIAVDTVILATGYRSENKIYEDLVTELPEIYLIGDALRPRNIKNAVWTAYEVARKI
jgi:2-enoate reductase